MFELLKKHPRFILFGLLTCFFTGPGQTFFLSFFTQAIQNEFNLSRTTLSTCFSLSTFGSAFVLPFIGRAFDRYSTRSVAMTMGAILALGYVILYLSKTIFFIFLAYLLIKSFAQGAMTIIYTSMISKYFGLHRGKALSLCNLGHPVSQSFFPIVLSFLLLNYGWKSSLVFIIIFVLIFYIPVVYFLFPKNNPPNAFYEDQNLNLPSSFLPKKSPENILKDWRFYVVSYGNIMAPLIVSGLFFQQDQILGFKHWGMTIFATGMTFFSVSQFTSNFFTGHLIDKFTATKIIPLGLIPLLIGLLGLKFGTHQYWCYFFFLFTGVTAVFTGTVKNAMWAEVYGTTTLGKLRGYDLQFNVFATALGPTAYALLLDHGMTPDELLTWIIITTATGIIVHTVASYFYSHPRISSLAPNN